MNINSNLKNGELLKAVRDVLEEKKETSAAIKQKLLMALSLRALEQTGDIGAALENHIAVEEAQQMSMKSDLTNINALQARHAMLQEEIRADVSALKTHDIMMLVQRHPKMFAFLCAVGYIVLSLGRPVILWALKLAGIPIPPEWFA